MSRLTIALGVALLAVEATVAVAIVATSSHNDQRSASIALAVTAGAAFVVSGLVAMARRPENMTGVYMAAVGYTWFLGALTDSNNPWVFSVGVVIGSVVFVPFAALLLAYPTGRFGSSLERAFPIAVGALVIPLSAAIALVDESPVPSCDDCPRNTLLVADLPGLASALANVLTGVAVLLSVAAVCLLVRRWRRAAPALRRTLWPVLAAGGAALTALVVNNLLGTFVSAGAGNAVSPFFLLCFSAVPLAFLLGILRTSLARSSVTDVVLALQAGVPLRDALARALRDPSLEVVYKLEQDRGSGSWVDVQGRRVDQPEPGAGRSLELVQRDGKPVAGVLYDASLDEEPELVDAVVGAAGLALHNERLQAELRAEATFLETIVSTAPSVLVNVDLDGRIRNLNLAALEVTGLEDADVRGQRFWDVFIDPGERSEMIARFRSAAPDFPPGEHENTFTNARGEQRRMYWRAAPVIDEHGRVLSIISGGIDITERHRLEVEREHERAFLDAITHNTPSLICLIDREGRVTERGINLAFERTLEWDDEDVEGRIFWEHWVDPAEVGEVRARIERVVGGETLGEHDNHWLTASGQRVSIAWTCRALPRIDERTLFLLSGTDVTERRRREEEIRAAEERFRAVIESAPVAIVEIGLDQCVDLWNPAAERIFGWSRDEVLGRPPPTIPDDRQDEFRALSAQEAMGNAYTGFETVRTRRDGTRLDVEISAAPIRDASGAVVGAMAVLGDISDRKRQEEELRASRARLVAAGDEARQQLERNLHDGAQQRLVALSIALRLAEAKLGEDPAAAAPILAGAREELALALDELRELARGIHPAILTDRGLRPALEALCARIPLPVELVVQSGPLPGDVEATAYYVVAESLTNVVKYAEASSAQVRVERTGDVLVVTVGDDGVGGADPALGTGLRGLADRVAVLDGSLDVESRNGTGTTVRAEIPIPGEAP